MWTLSGFSDEISDDFAQQCTVAKGLGLRYLRGSQRLGNQHPRPRQCPSSKTLPADALLNTTCKVSSIGSPIGKIYIDEDFAPHLDRMRHARRGRERARGSRTSGSSPFSCATGAAPTTTGTRCSSGCGRWPRSPSRRRDPAAREREGHLRRHPGPVPGHRRPVGSPTLQAGLGHGELRPGRRPPRYRRLCRPAAPPRLSQIKDAIAAAARSCWPARATASWGDPAALRDDGFEGFFSLEPHLADYSTVGGYSGPELSGGRPEAFTDSLNAERIQSA